MCGLFGFINRGKTAVDTTALTKGLAVSAQVRGRDATGVSYNIDGHLCTIKSATPADKFVYDLPRNVTALTGHTRNTTKGDEKFNYNNHPFPGTLGNMTFALAHNGVLDNDYELQLSEDLPKTNVQTDTYVAVQLLEKYAYTDGLSFDTIRSMAELVSGMFAFSILDSNNDFWFVRNDSPVCLAYFDKMNLYVYGSTEQIVKDGLKAADIKPKYRTINVPAGTMFHIDRAGKITFAEFEVNYASYNKYNPLYAIASGNKSSALDRDYGYSDSWYKHYDMESIITNDLYAEGCSYREIELLMNSFSLQELDSAIYSDKTDALLLMALREYFEEEEGSRCKPYVSPLHKEVR